MDRVTALSTAFDRAIGDPMRHDDAKQAKLEVTTGVSGKELQKIFDDLMATPQRWSKK